LGIQKKIGSQSTTTLRFEKPIGYSSTVVVPKGFLVNSVNGTRFSTDRALSIPSGVQFGDVTATSIGIGTSTNLSSGDVNRLVVPLVGIGSVVNIEASSGGSDEETDNELLTRTYELLRRRSLVTKDDYINETKLILGGDLNLNVKAWSGEELGFEDQERNIYISGVNSDGTDFNSSQLEKIHFYISQKIPLGTEVFVTPLNIIDVTARINVTTNGNIATRTIAQNIASSLSQSINQIQLEIGEELPVAYYQRNVFDVEGVVKVNSFTLNDYGCEQSVPISDLRSVFRCSKVIVNTDNNFIYDIDI
jgi:hypothetical protein